MYYPFKNLRSLESAKSRYRKLAMELHPDKGGSDEEFQELNRQYEEFQKTFHERQFNKKNAHTNHAPKAKRATSTNHAKQKTPRSEAAKRVKTKIKTVTEKLKTESRAVAKKVQKTPEYKEIADKTERYLQDVFIVGVRALRRHLEQLVD